jgi:hypothetical protein
MITLSFERVGTAIAGRRIRRPTFEERSLLPVSAACVVAGGVREALSRLIGEAVLLKFYEPAIPSAAAWEQIVRDARIYRVRGSRGEAAVILRMRDAAALAAAAFGERDAAATPLSALEAAVVDRTVRAFAAQFTALCGATEAPFLEEIHAIGGLETYVELQVEQPVHARIGIALARDPLPETQPGMAVESLLDLQVELCVRTDLGSYPALAIAELEPGVILPMPPPGAIRGTLEVAGSPLARGECGVNGGRYALVIDQFPDRREVPPA